jgi:2-oxo-4-hydroxy-4-carboxy-5-ureidoimidazoline decarboxylase
VTTSTIEALDAASPERFVALVGPTYEATPEVAEAVAGGRPFGSVDALHAAMTAVVDGFDDDQVLALLRAHPELGSRRPMAAHSVDEQRGAGLDRLAAATADELAAANAAYRERFGFPFIIAVRGRTSAEVLAELRRRLAADPADERRTAVAEVHRIARLRLDALVADAPDAAG